MSDDQAMQELIQRTVNDHPPAHGPTIAVALAAGWRGRDGEVNDLRDTIIGLGAEVRVYQRERDEARQSLAEANERLEVLHTISEKFERGLWNREQENEQLHNDLTQTEAKLGEALALQSIQYSRLSHFQADQEDMSHIDISVWCDEAMAYYPSSAALLLALGRATVALRQEMHQPGDLVLDGQEYWHRQSELRSVVYAAADAALADPTCEAILKEKE